MNALLSIKPEYADKIFSGEKQFEYRKSIFKRNVRKIIVYSTKPIGMIIGEFSIDGILEDEPQNLWEQTKELSGIKKDFFNDYFKGRVKGYAIRIGMRLLYEEPLDPHTVYGTFTAPQSFRYIEEEASKQLKLF